MSASHIDVRAYPSDATVSAGERFALLVDIVPHANVHVYAPGVSGYRPVALTIAEQPFVRILPMRYPASEIYVFKPLNERVAVYQKPFRLLQEVVLEASRPAQEAFRGRDAITLTGTLEYQACDDRTCFNPVSVPLSWTVALKPLAR
jgi:hypothetical protein